MKKRLNSSLLSITAFTLLSCSLSCRPEVKAEPIHDFSRLLQHVPEHSFLAQDGYYIWGASVVKGDDGKYHMFYSRWERSHGFDAWVTHSEIAHAVAEEPGGPFEFTDVALPPRGAAYWDGLTTHNPTVHKFNGRYYLYYMGTTGDGKVTSGLNWVHRNKQRIGVARADNPYGPWLRSHKPVLDVSPGEHAHDALMVSNPSVTQMKNGDFLMVYKAVAKRNPLPFGGPVSHLAAIARNPAGPFEKYPDRIFYAEGQEFPAEDPSIWYDAKADRYYAIVKDMKGGFTGREHALAFFSSEDGLEWEPGASPLVAALEITWETGTQQVIRLERPQILLEDGKPVMLYCAVAPGDYHTTATFNVHIPLKAGDEK